MKKILALTIIIAPLFIATFGFNLIKDSFFNIGPFVEFSPLIQGIIGLFLFLGSTIFLGGFIFRHDAKKKRINKYRKNL